MRKKGLGPRERLSDRVKLAISKIFWGNISESSCSLPLSLSLSVHFGGSILHRAVNSYFSLVLSCLVFTCAVLSSCILLQLALSVLSCLVFSCLVFFKLLRIILRQFSMRRTSSITDSKFSFSSSLLFPPLFFSFLFCGQISDWSCYYALTTK